MGLSMKFVFLWCKNILSYTRKGVKDWPLWLRAGAVLFPLFACTGLIFLTIGYKATTRVYTPPLHAGPVVTAKALAEKVEIVLAQLRDSLVLVSHHPEGVTGSLRENLPLYFQHNYEFITEIGFKSLGEKGFLLFRNGDSFHEMTVDVASQGPYSAFQQITSLPLHPGEVTLFPVVKAYYPTTPNRDRVEGRSVLRLALPLAERQGVLIVGVDIRAIKKMLGLYTRPGSPLSSADVQQALQLAYVFDTQGWILFEMHELGNTVEDTPDVARRGFSGDLGRPGLDSAFRPWAVHEDFWYMVKAAQSGISGWLTTSAAYYTSQFASSPAVLAFAPVRFASRQEGPGTVIGGVAFVETSPIPGQALGSVFTYGLLALVVLSAALGMLCVWLHRNMGRPLFLLAQDIKAMAGSSDFAAIEQTPFFEEHQRLIVAANGIISRAMNMQTTLARMEGEVNHVRAHLPANLAESSSISSTAQFTAEFGIVGSSEAICEVREEVKRAAKAGTDVLVWGETGTGKELVAEAIHSFSSRNAGPLISINCGALDESLLLDVLFGHTKGAFTEAKTERKGAFLTAEGGTLHLDEIGNASLQVQQALLRALSVRRIRPLGSDTEIPFNARVIAATNVDLRESVKESLFREDLYYRLAIISIKMPPLRNHREDIPELAAFCLQEFSPKLGKAGIQLSRGGLDKLTSHSWPGNVREFKNCMMRAIAFCEIDLILPQHIVLEEESDGAPKKLKRLFVPERELLVPGKKRAPLGAPPLGTGIVPEPPSTFSEKENWLRSGARVPFEGNPANLQFNERQKLVWPRVVRQGHISRAEYQALAGQDVSSRTAQLDLKEMVKLGVLKKVGGGPKVRYLLVKK